MSHAETWIFAPCVPGTFEMMEPAGYYSLANPNESRTGHLRVWEQPADLDGYDGLEHWLDLNA